VPPSTLTVALPYLADFTGDVGDLKPGTPVTLRGFTVGGTRSVHMAIDPKTAADRHYEPRCEL
jgi:ABC-type transporter Mla subunit MlaD